MGNEYESDCLAGGAHDYQRDGIDDHVVTYICSKCGDVQRFINR